MDATSLSFGPGKALNPRSSVNQGIPIEVFFSLKERPDPVPTWMPPKGRIKCNSC